MSSLAGISAGATPRAHSPATPTSGRGTGPPRVRRGGTRAFSALLQPGREPVLGHRLALTPLPVLIPDRPPAALLLARRVDRDPALQLDDFAAASGGCSAGAARDDPTAGR